AIAKHQSSDSRLPDGVDPGGLVKLTELDQKRKRQRNCCDADRTHFWKKEAGPDVDHQSPERVASVVGEERGYICSKLSRTIASDDHDSTRRKPGQAISFKGHC